MEEIKRNFVEMNNKMKWNNLSTKIKIALLFTGVFTLFNLFLLFNAVITCSPKSYGLSGLGCLGSAFLSLFSGLAFILVILIKNIPNITSSNGYVVYAGGMTVMIPIYFVIGLIIGFIYEKIKKRVIKT